MNILIDTHVFIWLDIARSKLSTTAQTTLRDADNIIYLSLASVWEIQIKSQLGKLELSSGVANVLRGQQTENGIQLLPISVEDILALETLANHHRDPFDRLLIAQAKQRNLTLMTNDRQIHQYDVNLLW